MDINNLLVKQFQKNNITIYGTFEKPLFKAKDIGELLEIKNIRDTVKNYNEKQRCVVLTDTGFGVKEIIYLTEQGLYKVLMKSKKPIAEKFQDWVCEIIEEIRKTGEYKSNKNIEHVTKNNLFIEQYQTKPIVYLGMVEDNQIEQIVKYGYTTNTKTTLKRHQESYGEDFHYIYALECKEHYNLEKKIQTHNDLTSRHIKKYDGKERQELLRLDKNFNIKNLISLIVKMKEIMENDKELLMEQEKTKQLMLQLELKKLELEMKKLEYNKQPHIENEVYNEKIKPDLIVKVNVNNNIFINYIKKGTTKYDYLKLDDLYTEYIKWYNQDNINCTENILTKNEFKFKVQEHIKNNLGIKKYEYDRYMINYKRVYGWKYVLLNKF